MNFKNKVVLITGGSRGIGKATSLAFAEKEAYVVFSYNTDRNAADATLNSLPGSGHNVVQGDLGNPSDIMTMVDDVIDKYGRIDVLVNNVGIHKDHEIDKVSYQEWQRHWDETLNVNLVGTSNMIYCVTQHMIKQGGGKIVNVSSRGAFRGEPTFPAYGASKAGMNSLGQSLAQKLAPYNIYIGTVAPGFVQTDMTKARLAGPEGVKIKAQSPFNRVARPEEVAHAIMFLASDGSEWCTGTIIDVNGASYLRS
ncbi:MAG: SDR family oxidoreductase [Bacteroidia bacterium]|nr:SDR family oxidoreductase [Bacteroidia bacterium]